MSIKTPVEKHKLNKPRKGDSLTYRGKPEGIISRVEDAICHYEKLGGSSGLFIWVFKEGLNELFEWPNKWETRLIIMGDPVRIANSRAG